MNMIMSMGVINPPFSVYSWWFRLVFYHFKGHYNVDYMGKQTEEILLRWIITRNRIILSAFIDMQSEFYY